MTPIICAKTSPPKKAIPVIPNNPSRALKYPLDKHFYAQRHLVECCLSKLKQFRRVATRFETLPARSCDCRTPASSGWTKATAETFAMVIARRVWRRRFSYQTGLIKSLLGMKSSICRTSNAE
jgi:transposase